MTTQTTTQKAEAQGKSRSALLLGLGVGDLYVLNVGTGDQKRITATPVSTPNPTGSRW